MLTTDVQIEFFHGSQLHTDSVTCRIYPKHTALSLPCEYLPKKVNMLVQTDIKRDSIKELSNTFNRIYRQWFAVLYLETIRYILCH
jgi:hypothetical protein